MKIDISIKGIHEHTAEKDQALRNYINDGLKDLDKLLSHVKEPIYFDITLDVERQHHHHACDMRVHAPHFEIIVKKEDPEMYKAIDKAIDTLKEELVRHKDKQVSLRKEGFPK